jgi:predicted dehydrogenase
MSISRRNFMKAAGIGAGVAIATTYSPRAYAQNDKLRVACIGTGGQGSLHLRDGLANAQGMEVVAVCDVYRPHLEGGWNEAGKKESIKRYRDYKEMLDKEKPDAVVIATPLSTHFQIAMDCLDAGKHVFLEKTMCYDLDQCRQLVKKCHDTGLFVQVGHQRRYNPFYNKAMCQFREQNKIGRLNFINAQWHRNNDWRRPVDPNYTFDDRTGHAPT